MKQVLCWSFPNSALITAALVAPSQSDRSAVIIMSALVLLSLGLLWNICRTKESLKAHFRERLKDPAGREAVRKEIAALTGFPVNQVKFEDDPENC